MSLTRDPAHDSCIISTLQNQPPKCTLTHSSSPNTPSSSFQGSLPAESTPSDNSALTSTLEDNPEDSASTILNQQLGEGFDRPVEQQLTPNDIGHTSLPPSRANTSGGRRQGRGGGRGRGRGRVGEAQKANKEAVRNSTGRQGRRARVNSPVSPASTLTSQKRGLHADDFPEDEEVQLIDGRRGVFKKVGYVLRISQQHLSNAV